MRHLLDVNVLLALGHGAHPDHEKARQWFASLPATDGLASCSITEIGFLRVSINARLAANLGEAKTVLAGLLSSPRFSRLNDDIGFDALPAYVTKAAEITDGHLLALAQRHHAKFATLDVGIPGAELIR
jgi:toxin-antitoxin system PIN domain toxin